MSAAVTPWGRWLAGDDPRGKDERRLFAEYDATASDADRAYARQARILNGHPAAIPVDASAEVLFSALFERRAA